MSRPRPLILNIDDDLPGRYAVTRTLKQSGFDVIDAETGESGFRTAQSVHPDLILLDIRLPDIDGFEVCRLIREDPATFGTPVLHMSASYRDATSRVKGLDNGADAYLTEPVEPAVLVATINSLLRLKRAENSVRQTALEWQSTFDAIGDGVALLDSEGRVTRQNRSLKWSTELEALVKGGFDRLLVQRRRQQEEAVTGDRTIVITLDPMVDASKDVSGAVCVVCDVTEKRRFESQLRQTARLESIGVLAGGIAHDFNNLLTGILGNASLLLDCVPDNGDRDLVQEIVKASERAADLTRQILTYSGKARVIMHPLDLSAQALETRPFVRRFIPPKVELRFDTPSGLPYTLADSGQMQQLLMNLIINGAESIPNATRGVVHVSTGVQHLDADFFRPDEPNNPGDYVKLRVSDTGCGMDEATRGSIFDPFFTTKFTGRGLGLSAVHGILRSHKGLLRLDSSPGKGSTFDIYLPVTHATPPRATQTASAPARGPAWGTVLIVDDEPVVQTFAQAALESRGYSVALADNGQAGLQLLQSRKSEIRVVVLDLTMPVMDGEETFGQIRQVANDLPVILISGFSHRVAEEKFHGKGLAGFLGKPFTGGQLVEAVDKALSCAGSRARE